MDRIDAEKLVPLQGVASENVSYAEDDLIMISALAHFSYCPRRCALIHIEQAWEENQFTAEGRIMHEKVHEEGNESRGSVQIARGLSLRSLRLGLIGVADVVEFHCLGKNLWQPFPVEYKHGKPKPDHCDAVQLCAQAMCLEEMLFVNVPRGALFYGRTRRRADVNFDDPLRRETEAVAEQARNLILGGVTPPPTYAKRCQRCSLVGECLPKKMEKRSSIRRYLERMTSEGGS